MAYATVTLTGTYQTPDGTPHKGHVEIIPSERVIKDTTGDVILTGRVKVELDAQGAFSVALPATDDPTLNPSGFGYTIAAKLHSSHPPAVSFSLPASLGATTVEDLTPVDPSTFAPTTTYAEKTELDAVAATIPSTAADVNALPDTTTPADLGAEPAGLSQTTQDTLDATYAPHSADTYGATGDGTTDDTTALQTCLNAATATNGGTMHIPAGTYRITAPLTVVNTTGVDTSGPRVVGAGKHRTVLVCDFDNGPAFDVTGCEVPPPANIADTVFMRGGGITDLGITQTEGRTGIIGIRAIGWWYPEIARLDIQVSSHAIHIPKRDDINTNPDFYACAGWHIHKNDLSLNGGKGIYGEAGLGFPYPNIEHNRITNNLSDGVWVAGHGPRISQNAIAANGRYDEVTQGPASGIVIGFVPGQATTNGVEITQNELQGNVTDNVRLVACSGFNLSRNRLLSDVTTVSGTTALYPPVHMALGVASQVQIVANGNLAGNYHRSDPTGSYPLSVYKVGHTSAANHRIENNRVQAADNTPAMVKYDGFNTNHNTEIIEGGKLANIALSSLWYLGRIRTAANITGTMSQVVFDNEWLDPSSSNDPTLGYLTPFLGAYRVDFQVTVSGLAAGNAVEFRIYSGGAAVKTFIFTAGGSSNETFTGSAMVYVAGNTRLTLRAAQYSGTDKAILVSDAHNSLSIQALR